MTAEPPVLEALDFDFDHPLAGIEEIRAVNWTRSFLDRYLRIPSVSAHGTGLRDANPD